MVTSRCSYDFQGRRLTSTLYPHPHDGNKTQALFSRRDGSRRRCDLYIDTMDNKIYILPSAFRRTFIVCLVETLLLFYSKPSSYFRNPPEIRVGTLFTNILYNIRVFVYLYYTALVCRYISGGKSYARRNSQ